MCVRLDSWERRKEGCLEYEYLVLRTGHLALGSRSGNGEKEGRGGGSSGGSNGQGVRLKASSHLPVGCGR